MLQDMHFSYIFYLKLMSKVFSPASVIFAGIGILLSVCIFNNFSRVIVTRISQAAKDVGASHDTLVEILEQIERFFRRLEIYTELQPTEEMMNMIIEIMVEVISILGIATKDVNQGRISKYLLYKRIAVD